jgi:hypothetical protein
MTVVTPLDRTGSVAQDFEAGPKQSEQNAWADLALFARIRGLQSGKQSTPAARESSHSAPVKANVNNTKLAKRSPPQRIDKRIGTPMRPEVSRRPLTR